MSIYDLILKEALKKSHEMGDLKKFITIEELSEILENVKRIFI